MYRPRSLINQLAFRDDVSILEALQRVRWVSILSILLGPVLAALALWAVSDIDTDVLPSHGKLMLSIFTIAAWYWITGAIPPFATAVLVIGLGALLVGYPAELLPEGAREAGSSISGWTEFVEPGVAPVVILMLGGFVMSRVAHQTRLDREFAGVFIRPFAHNPKALVLGVLIITAMFSMWISNTATAAMMIALIAPIAGKLDPGSNLRRSLLLAVPIGANVGGIGTPIGTPPNAIAFGALRAAGIDITFLGWMTFAIPFVIVMLAVAWALLMLLYPPSNEERSHGVKWAKEAKFEHTWEHWVTLATFAVTVGLWVSSPWTKAPIGAVALIPIVVFTVTKIIDRRDINRLEWDILLLITGGLALGMGMERSGLASWMVTLLPIDAMSTAGVLTALAFSTLLIATFMSNTAASNLLIPLGLGVATQTGMNPGVVGVAIALSASLAMSLPVSTPPNAIAFAAGTMKTSDFVKSGVILGAIGLGLIAVLCLLVLPATGLVGVPPAPSTPAG